MKNHRKSSDFTKLLLSFRSEKYSRRCMDVEFNIFGISSPFKKNKYNNFFVAFKAFSCVVICSKRAPCYFRFFFLIDIMAYTKASVLRQGQRLEDMGFSETMFLLLGQYFVLDAYHTIYEEVARFYLV